jgi:hypothetical protein
MPVPAGAVGSIPMLDRAKSDLLTGFEKARRLLRSVTS